MKRETFFNAMTPDYNTDDGRELALLDDLRVFMTETKHHNADFFKNIIYLCWNYLQELTGLKDEDGNDILNEIIKAAEQQMPDAFILAGDLYDKAVPSAEAVQLFDRFLTRLSKLTSQFL